MGGDLYRQQPVSQIEEQQKMKRIEVYRQEQCETRQVLHAIEECVRHYLAANTVADISAWSRNPERVQWLMVDYYRKHKRPHLALKAIESMTPASIGQRPFLLVKVEVENLDRKKLDQSREAFVSLVLEQTAEFEFKVDWETDVFYQPMEWKEYLHKRPLRPLSMRVLVSKADFYVFAFRDKTRYQSYRLSVPGETDDLLAYVERDSLVDLRLRALLSPETVEDLKTKRRKVSETKELSLQDDGLFFLDGVIESPREKSSDAPQITRPVILSIRFLREDASMRSVYIDALVSENWVYQLPSSEGRVDSQ
jgi:hypothetical protein